MRTIELNNRLFDEYITTDKIQEAVRAVADRINTDYAGREPLFICVLNGAYIYAADLFRAINLHSEITFVRLKSYEGTSTTGNVRMIVPLQEEVKDRDVVVIEDIVDTGITMHGFKQLLREQGARSVAVTSFLFKPEALLHPDAEPEYVAIRIPRKFILGYGLDYDGFGRNLDAVYALRD